MWKSSMQRSSINIFSLSDFFKGLLSRILQPDKRKKYLALFINKKKETPQIFKQRSTNLQSLIVIKSLTLNLLYWQMFLDKE